MIYVFAILMIASMALFVAIHIWWKGAIRHGIVGSDTMGKREKLRNAQIFLLILFLSSALVVGESVIGASISGLQSAILIGLMFGMSRNLFEPFHTIETVPMLEEYALYLRPFDIDEQSILKKRSGFAKNACYIPENLEKAICRSLNKEIAPVYAIGNPGAVLPTTLDSSCIYVKDQDWKTAVADLADKAKMILLRVGDSEGCRWELLHCFDHDYLTKTILIADDACDIDMIQRHTSIPIASSIREIDFGSNSVGMWIDWKGEWQYEILKTTDNCAAMVDLFAKTHPHLLRRDIKIGSVLKTKSKSFWPDAVSLILNPIAYVLYNRWSRKMVGLLLSYIFVSIMAVAILSLSLADDEDAAFASFVALGLPLLLLSFIPWLIFAPKYTTAINSWGGPEIKAHANKRLAIWLTIIFAMMIVLESLL